VVTIEGNVISDISVAGGREFEAERNLLKMGVVKRAEGEEHTLRILVKGPERENVKFEVAEVDPDDILQVQLGEPETYERLVSIPLRVRVPANAQLVNRLGSEQGEVGSIRLTSNHSVMKEFKLYISFVVQE
jgi:hypothetical protein